MPGLQVGHQSQKRKSDQERRDEIPKKDERQGEEEEMKRQNFLVPAVLSAAICPGLGQMVKGEGLKGIGILVGLVLALFLTVIFAVLFSIELGIALSAGVVGLYGWNIYDAYSHVPKGN